MKNFISLREIADDNSSISSTRWAFASVVKFDIIVILMILVSYIVAHFLGKDFSNDLISGAAVLLGILTGIVTTSKALQGFETGNEATAKTTTTADSDGKTTVTVEKVEQFEGK